MNRNVNEKYKERNGIIKNNENMKENEKLN